MADALERCASSPSCAHHLPTLDTGVSSLPKNGREAALQVAKLGFGIVDTDAHHEFISIASEAIWAHRSSETEKNNESTRKNLAGNVRRDSAHY